MMEDPVAEDLQPLNPAGAAEAAVSDAAAPVAPEVAGGGGETVPEPPKVPKPPLRQGSMLTLESLESPFRNPQPAPIHWAVGWADLMMTMFILFLVLYLYPSAKEAQSQQAAQQSQGVTQESGATGQGEGGQGVTGQGQAERTQTGQEAAELMRLGTDTTAGSSDPAVTTTAKLFDLTKLTREDEEFARFAEIDLSPDRTVRIVLAADLLFPSGSADLHLIAKENIKKISELLQETPHKINVVGHTDDQPIRGGAFATNWELSVMRATAVARFLIEEMGVAPSRITASGQSFYQPQVNNNSPENRAKNRRVEIIVSLDPAPTLPLTNPNILSTPGANR